MILPNIGEPWKLGHAVAWLEAPTPSACIPPQVCGETVGVWASSIWGPRYSPSILVSLSVDMHRYKADMDPQAMCIIALEEGSCQLAAT